MLGFPCIFYAQIIPRLAVIHYNSRFDYMTTSFDGGNTYFIVSVMDFPSNNFHCVMFAFSELAFVWYSFVC